MSILDNIEEQRVDISKLVNENRFLASGEIDMKFRFEFMITENVSYYLLHIRGILNDILGILSCSTNINRFNIGEICVSKDSLKETSRIFYDEEIYSKPVIYSKNNYYQFEICINLCRQFRITEAMRVICPICQILYDFSSHHYPMNIRAKILRFIDMYGEYDFSKMIEYLSSFKKRFRNVKEDELNGICNTLNNLLVMCDKDIFVHGKSDHIKHQLKNYLGNANCQ